MLVVWFRGVRTREVMAYFPSLCLNVQKPGTSKVREKSLFRSMKHAYIYISIYLYLYIYIERERERENKLLFLEIFIISYPVSKGFL